MFWHRKLKKQEILSSRLNYPFINLTSRTILDEQIRCQLSAENSIKPWTFRYKFFLNRKRARVCWWSRMFEGIPGDVYKTTAVDPFSVLRKLKCWSLVDTEKRWCFICHSDNIEYSQTISPFLTSSTDNKQQKESRSIKNIKPKALQYSQYIKLSLQIITKSHFLHHFVVTLLLS